MTEKPIRVLLIDDHPPLRAGIRALLDQDDAIEVVAEASDGATGLEAIQTLQPTVTVLDCELPDMDGPTVAASIAERKLPTEILVLSAHNNKTYIKQMLAAGAKGYLLKSETAAVILAAVKQVADGQAFFSASVAAQLATIMSEGESDALAPTPREQEVLEWVAKGMNNREIARQLIIAERTVAYHVQNLLNKLGVNNRTEMVVEAIRKGWLTL